MPQARKSPRATRTKKCGRFAGEKVWPDWSEKRRLVRGRFHLANKMLMQGGSWLTSDNRFCVPCRHFQRSQSPAKSANRVRPPGAAYRQLRSRFRNIRALALLLPEGKTMLR